MTIAFRLSIAFKVPESDCAHTGHAVQASSMIHKVNNHCRCFTSRPSPKEFVEYLGPDSIPAFHPKSLYA
jgi:hypothetical protein